MYLPGPKRMCKLSASDIMHPMEARATSANTEAVVRLRTAAFRFAWVAMYVALSVREM